MKIDSGSIFFNLDIERQRRGFTVKEFCIRLGISTRTWSNYKKDPRSVPNGVIDDASDLMKIPRMNLELGGVEYGSK